MLVLMLGEELGWVGKGPEDHKALKLSPWTAGSNLSGWHPLAWGSCSMPDDSSSFLPQGWPFALFP